MNFKVVNFLFDRITGWCFDPDRPGVPVELECKVNGQTAAIFQANRLRRELSRAKFAHRSIGFATQLPLEHWTGRACEVVLQVAGEGPVLAQGEMTPPDIRLPGVGGLVGEIAAPAFGLLRGWVAACDRAMNTGFALSETPVKVSLLIDGRRVRQQVAAGDSDPGRPGGHGFAFWLPDGLYDGKVHELVLALEGPGMAPEAFHTLQHAFAPEERRQVSGRILSFAAGQLTGTAELKGWPALPITLVADTGVDEIGRAETQPDQGGGFELVLTPQTAWVLGRDRLEIYDSETGQTPDFAAGDLLASFLGVEATGSAADRIDIKLLCPCAVTGVAPAELTLPSGAVLPLSFEAVQEGESRCFQATVTLPESLSDACVRLRIGDIERDLTVVQAVEAPPMDLDQKLERTPAIEGAWQLSPCGRVSGWIRDRHAPDRPLAVSLLVNGNEVATCLADAWVRPPGADLPEACGFVWDLRGLDLNPGRVRLSICGPDAVELPTGGPTTLRLPLSTALPLPAAAELYGLSAGLSDPDLRSRLLVPPTPEVESLIRRLMGEAQAAPPGGAVDATVSLAAWLRRVVAIWAGDEALMKTLVTPGLQPDPARWSPLTPPTADELALLPLSPDGRALLAHASTPLSDWRFIVRLLASDDLLFPCVLDPNDGADMRRLFVLRRATGRIATHPPLEIVCRETGPLWPEDARDLRRIVLVDPNGQQVLRLDHPEPAGFAAAALADLPAVVADPRALERQTGWLALVTDPSGHSLVRPLTWIADLRLPPVGTNPEVVLSDLQLGPRYVRATLTGIGLPAKLSLRIGTTRIALSPLASDVHTKETFDGGDGRLRHYAAALPLGLWPAQAAEGAVAPFMHVLHWKGAPQDRTWDLQITDHKGLRPAGLPEHLPLERSPEIAAQTELTRGQWVGWVADPASDPANLRLELIETVSLEPERLAELRLIDPDVPETEDRVLEQAVPNLPSEAGLARTGLRACGFAINLPGSLLDGAPHTLRLELCRADGERHRLWSDTWCATEDRLDVQMDACTTEAQLNPLLLRLVLARRPDPVERLLARPASARPVTPGLEPTCEILTVAAVLDLIGPDQPRMAQMHAALWTMVTHNDKRARNFPLIAAKATLRALQDAPPARFPHSPEAEAALDLVLSTPLDKAAAGFLSDLAAICQRTRRLTKARDILRHGLEQHPKDGGLWVQMSGVRLALGDPAGAEAAALRALDERASHAPALMALARALARQGRLLEAASALSGGKGLSHWANQPPSYETAKLLAALDWPGLIEGAASALGHVGLQATTQRVRSVLCPPPSLTEEGMTLVLPQAGPGPLADLFAELQALGCRQIVPELPQRLSDIECIGRWAVILTAVKRPSPQLIASLMAQRHPHETVLRLMTGQVSDKGVPTGFTLVGAVIRNDVLQALGQSALPAFLETAANRLRVKTVLI